MALRDDKILVGGFCQFLIEMALRVFAEKKTKSVRFFRCGDACFSTDKNIDSRLPAGLVLACTLPQSSSTDSLNHDRDQSNVQFSIPMCQCSSYFILLSNSRVWDMHVASPDHEKMILFGRSGKYLAFIARIDDADFWS